MFVPNIRAAVRSFREHRARAGAIRTLSGLDDAILKDMGIHRSQIESVVQNMPIRIRR